MADAPAQSVTNSAIRAEIAGNALLLLDTGAERLRVLLELIAGAERSLRMLMYMFNPDHTGAVVRDALVEAARRGVEVKVLIDGFGSAAPARFFADLDESGGQYCVFNPTFGRRYLLRNHQKLVDRRRSYRHHRRRQHRRHLYDGSTGREHWRDLWLRIEGPAAAMREPLFRYAVPLVAPRTTAKLRSLRRMVGEYSEWRGPLQWKFSGPLSMRNSWWRSIGRRHQGCEHGST